MRAEWVRRFAALFVADAVLCLAAPAWNQTLAPGSGGVMQAPAGSRLGSLSDELGSDPGFAEKRLRALNDERHKSIVSDTAKLVKLARQLDAEIASNPTDELTEEESHKAAEIEKLARNVKAKMAQSFGGGPVFRPMPVPLAGSGVR